MSGSWTAILLAGERPGENAFAASHGVASKALIPVGGEAMLGRVARSLLNVDAIGRILVLAQRPDLLFQGSLAWMDNEPRIATATSGDGIAVSIDKVAGKVAPFPVLVTTADHALLTPDMVEAFIDGSDGYDVAVALVERRTVEAAYPETKRTWLRFRGGDYTGANLFALRTQASQTAVRIWSNVERDRKKVFRLFFFFGPLLALRALTRTISLDNALKTVGQRLSISIRAVRLPFADAAVDVDKPADLELAEQILAARTEHQ